MVTILVKMSTFYVEKIFFCADQKIKSKNKNRAIVEIKYV